MALDTEAEFDSCPRVDRLQSNTTFSKGAEPSDVIFDPRDKKILNWEDIISSIDNIGRFVRYVGGNRSPGGNHAARPGIEPTDLGGDSADVNFEHRSYHCATLTAQISGEEIVCNPRWAEGWNRALTWHHVPKIAAWGKNKKNRVSFLPILPYLGIFRPVWM
jgi:hypothetical protein